MSVKVSDSKKIDIYSKKCVMSFLFSIINHTSKQKIHIH